MKSLRIVLPTLAVSFAFAATFFIGEPAAASGVTPATTPTPFQRPRTTPTASPAPVVSPRPQASASPTPAVRSAQTLEELQSKIRTRIADPNVRRGRVGVKIVSLSSGKVLFENDAEKYFMPASNMKNFTIAAGFERLGADFRFVTSVYASQPPDASGIVRGDVRVYGRGDVSISTAFNNGDYYKGLDNLVDKIAAAGVKRIEGALVADESYFKGFYIPVTWEWDDLQSYYGAEVSPLPVNDNAVDLAVTPGAVGSPCIVTVSPQTSLYQITNLCTTAGGGKRSLSVTKKIDRNVLEVTGTIPADDKGYRTSISITRPAEHFVGLLKQRLELRGISVGSPSRLMPAGVRGDPAQVEIARLESVPFGRIAANTMKPSQNMFTEVVLWTLGEQFGRPSSATADSSQLGIDVVKSFLKQAGIDEDGIIQYDGSGLSRHNLITPDAVVKLYTYMAKQSRNAQAWRDSLTIAGIDGTLANRLKGTAAEGNFRGKTGTIDQVSALSGYMRTAAGEELVVSILVNGVTVPRNRTSLADDIVLALANFNGRVD